MNLEVEVKLFPGTRYYALWRNAPLTLRVRLSTY